MTGRSDPGRTGRYAQQPTGYFAFIPAKLPFSPSIRYDEDLQLLLSNADRAIGHLDALADLLPNPDLFIQMYVRKEALWSSRIEGVTQASLSDFIQEETRSRSRIVPAEIAEVLNYVKAMNHGLERLKTLPLSNRLIREIHGVLLQGVRGSQWQPGEFRHSQNWIGAGGGANLASAVFVPPPPAEMEQSLNDLELYLHRGSQEPILVKAGLIHYQFETIHPFLDGNGRMGRLLVAFYLYQQKVLTRPLLYLSAYIDANKEEYYARLQTVRDEGNLESWLEYFLTAVWRVAEAASTTGKELLRLRERDRQKISDVSPHSALGIRLLDDLFRSPIIEVNDAREWLGISYPSANKIVGSLTDVGILKEITGQGRNRLFAYEEYLQIMDEGLKVSPGDQEKPTDSVVDDMTI